jgi:hypothetical protein
MAMATNEPIGNNESERMNAMVTKNLSRASAAWTGLSRSM